MNTTTQRLTPKDTYPAKLLAADVRFAVSKMNTHGGFVYTSFSIAGRFSILLQGKPAAVDTVAAGLKVLGWEPLKQPPEVESAIETLFNYDPELNATTRN